MDRLFRPFAHHDDSDTTANYQQQEEHAVSESRDSHHGRHDIQRSLEEGNNGGTSHNENLSDFHNENPIQQSRTLRVAKGIGSIAHGIKKTSSKIARKTGQMMHGTQQEQKLEHGAPKVSQGTHSAVAAMSSSQRRSSEEPTESQPLMDSSSSSSSSREIDKYNSLPSTKGEALWDRLRKHRDSLVFHLHSQDSLNDDADDEDSESRRQRLSSQYMENIRRLVDYSLLQCVLAIAFYLAIAVVAYSFLFEKWTIVDSLYFACVTFTTIGYGDLSPSSNPSRLFTACFALIGVACLGVALGVIGSNLIDDQRTATNHAREMSKYQAMSLFEESTRSISTVSSEEAASRKQSTTTKPAIPWYRTRFVSQVLPVFGVLFVCSWMLGTQSRWNLVTTFYFTIISACTIGFGDFYPTSQAARLFSVLYIPVAVGAMGQWLSIIGNSIIERRQARFRKEMETHELTMQDIHAMDDNGDGQVTRVEFIEFMLVAMNKVDKDLMDELRFQFDRLDEDGTGVLQREDLIIAAKKKLQSPRRKLELAQYKKHLLSLSDKNLQQNRKRRFSLVDVIYPPIND